MKNNMNAKEFLDTLEGFFQDVDDVTGETVPRNDDGDYFYAADYLNELEDEHFSGNIKLSGGTPNYDSLEYISKLKNIKN